MPLKVVRGSTVMNIRNLTENCSFYISKCDGPTLTEFLFLKCYFRIFLTSLAETKRKNCLSSMVVQREAGCIPGKGVEVVSDRLALLKSGEQSWTPYRRLDLAAN